MWKKTTVVTCRISTEVDPLLPPKLGIEIFEQSPGQLKVIATFRDGDEANQFVAALLSFMGSWKAIAHDVPGLLNRLRAEFHRRLQR